MNIQRIAALFAASVLIALAGCSKEAAAPSETPGASSKPAAAPAAPAARAAAVEAAAYPNHAYWGDEHVHSGWSGDAGLAGTTLSPEDAVRFARGDEVTSNTGQKAKLAEPLDWVAVTEHSDGMGTINELRAGNPEFMADPTAKRWSEMMRRGGEEASTAQREAVRAQANKQLPKVFMNPQWMVSAWQKIIDVMEKYNEPGKFTAFIAYEWTSNAGGGNNLHRNVIYRDGGVRARQVNPLTTFVSEDPAALWQWLANYEAETGGKLLAIPHNGNLSNGRMFEEQQFDGKPMTRDWAETRARWEPLFVYYQYKGQSEEHPRLSPTDEFANFDVWDNANLAGVAKQPGMVATEYAREALKSGLRIEGSLGANPFKFGAAAGTDTHTGLSAPVEGNFWGKFPASEPSAERWNEVYAKQGDFVRRDWTQAAAGLTAVWATENTREALWDAMKRKETYASTGPRITLRFFGGDGFTNDDAKGSDLVAAGYSRGVPMGGDLKVAAGKAPTFLIAAMKDPAGGNLDRAQIVKGWVDAAGATHEAIYEVAWSDPANRKPVDGKLPAVGNTVDVKTATYTNTIGAPELVGTFTDPQFDPTQRAFYYLRVLEIPTPRWTDYDVARFHVTMTPDVPLTAQERAVSSPIWYTPS
jgi:hypothetical protein